MTPSYSQREESFSSGYGQSGSTYQQGSYNTSSYQSGRGGYEDTSVQESFSNLNVRDVPPISRLANDQDEGSSSRRYEEDSQEYDRGY